MQTLTFPQFVALPDEPHLNETLDVLDNMGCVFNYVPFRQNDAPDQSSHAQRSLEAMERIAAFYDHRAQTLSNRDFPIEQFWRVSFDAAKLNGEPINAAQFWGNDDAFPTPTGESSFLIPERDGYKTAFFNPPYPLRLSPKEQIELFERVNKQLWNGDLSDCTIYNWSTNWSNYFDSGHEWWGAFWWTIYSPQTRLITAIGASATD